MAVSQRSMKAAFMQPWRGVKKSDTERDIIHLHPNRAVGGGLLCFDYLGCWHLGCAVAIGECGFSLSVSLFFSIFAAERKQYDCCEQSKQ